MEGFCKDGYCHCNGVDYDYDTCLRKLLSWLILTVSNYGYPGWTSCEGLIN
jgi:hypothetical protein